MGRWRERIFGTGVEVFEEEGRVVWKKYHPASKAVQPLVDYPFMGGGGRLLYPIEVEIPAWFELGVDLEKGKIGRLEVDREIFQSAEIGGRVRRTMVFTSPKFLGIPLAFLGERKVTVEIPGREFFEI